MTVDEIGEREGGSLKEEDIFEFKKKAGFFDCLGLICCQMAEGLD